MAKYSLPTFLSQAMSSKFVHLRHHGVQRNPGRAMMDEDRVAVIRNNLATRALLVHDLAIASKMGVEALERIEDDLLAIGALAD
jgi:hypothetical protein